MDSSTHDQPTGGAAAVSRSPRRLMHPVPPEGTGGFSRTWFPICQSGDVAAGEVIGRDFLDGRVVVVRGASGDASVMSAYCPHLGADLSLGTVIDDDLRCAFHHFRFDSAGRCTATGSGDPVPKHAELFAFPTAERCGLVWAFNGVEAAWELPYFELDGDNFVSRCFPPVTLQCDPWTVIANTADFQHFRFLHGFGFDFDTVAAGYEWNDNGLTADLRATLPDRHTANEVRYYVTHYGTNMTWVEATIDGSTAQLLIGLGIPRTGETEIYTVVAAERHDSSDAAGATADAVLDQLGSVFGLMGAEDNPILGSAHFMPGAMTVTDRQLVHFLQYVRNYPRQHPSADFIR